MLCVNASGVQVACRELHLNVQKPGCVLSPLLFTLMTHKCSARFSRSRVIKFTDDTTVVGLITNKDERACRKAVEQLTVENSEVERVHSTRFLGILSD